MVDVYHLYHSGVAVETENNFFIFDYYRDSSAGEERKLKNGVIEPGEIKEKRKNVYVFVSHSHGDHYNPVIFEWERKLPEINYILSNDINSITGKNRYSLSPDQELTVNNIEVKTFGSTDRGVSFLVREKGITIFHAGDLNWWHWESFTTSELKKEEKDYKREITKIKNHDINLAFVPVDPRLNEHYYLAGEYFINKVKPDYFFPIHFSSDYKITDTFANRFDNPEAEIMSIKNRKNAHFKLDIQG